MSHFLKKIYFLFRKRTMKLFSDIKYFLKLNYKKKSQKTLIIILKS